MFNGWQNQKEVVAAGEEVLQWYKTRSSLVGKATMIEQLPDSVPYDSTGSKRLQEGRELSAPSQLVLERRSLVCAFSLYCG